MKINGLFNGLFIRQALRGALALATVAFLRLDWLVSQFPNMKTEADGGISATFTVFGREETWIGLEWLPVTVSVIKWALALMIFLWLSTAAWSDRQGEPGRRRHWERKRRRRTGEERSE